MKTKLTLTIDAELVPRAKAYAAGQGRSLSSLVEATLREKTEQARPSFVARWGGAFTLADHGDDPRFRALVAKYLNDGA